MSTTMTDTDVLKELIKLTTQRNLLLAALRTMIECYATPTTERNSYEYTRKQAADMARAAIAAAEGTQVPQVPEGREEC